jgi:hypothetical protein
VVAHLAGLLPSADADIVDGADVAVAKYLDLVDAEDGDVTLKSDDAYQVIGGDKVSAP